MNNKLEKQLDQRLAEIGFPEADQPNMPEEVRLELARCIGLFYSGALLIVDRSGGQLKITTRP